MGHYRSRVRAIGVYTDGVARDISSRVAWLSSATGVATVVTEGAIAGVVETGDAGPNGTTLISASLNGMWGDIVLGTWTDTANNIHIYPDPQAQLALGMTRQLQVIATLNSTIRWCITELAGVDWQPDSHVTINEAAGTRGRMQGILAGTASIGASLGGLTANSSVEIVDKAVDYIKVTPATMSLQPGGVGYFHAVIVYTDGSEQDVTTAATFYEERPDVSWPTEPLPTLFTANAVLGGVMTAKSAANLVPGVTRLNACWGGAPGTGVCAWWSGAVPPNPQATDRRAVVTVSP
jgi:hypothetical protein